MSLDDLFSHTIKCDLRTICFPLGEVKATRSNGEKLDTRGEKRGHHHRSSLSPLENDDDHHHACIARRQIIPHKDCSQKGKSLNAKITRVQLKSHAFGVSSSSNINRHERERQGKGAGHSILILTFPLLLTQTKLFCNNNS